MSASSYNGWSNYATWRVHRELFDGMDFYDWYSFRDDMNPYNLAPLLKDFADDAIIGAQEGLIANYARAFLQDVDWMEIAEHILEAYSHADTGMEE
jgi:hypothetical protein